jgi:hypothetical protein
MSRGNSGRIVLEVDTSIKDALYIALAKQKLTLKEWFLMQCTQYIYDTNQPYLFKSIAAELQPSYNKKDNL